jgi:hypothetical protein
MNNRFFIPSIALIVFLIVAASCGSSRTTTSRYPYPGSPYPYPEGKYPEVIHIRPPILVSDIRITEDILNTFSGQAKKIYRSRSAKVYAPGQRRKYERNEHCDNQHDKTYKDHKREIIKQRK